MADETRLALDRGTIGRCLSATIPAASRMDEIPPRPQTYRRPTAAAGIYLLTSTALPHADRLIPTERAMTIVMPSRRLIR